MRKKAILGVLAIAACTLPSALFAAPKWVLAVNGAHSQGSVPWMTNYDSAAKKAAAENKPMMLFFTGSDWCGWCKKMDSEILETAGFAQTAGSKFVFVKLDFPMRSGSVSADEAQQNATLKEKFGVTGFPTVVLLSSDGTFIAQTGYRSISGAEYGNYLNELVK